MNSEHNATVQAFALIGPSGSGKTTLAKKLLNDYPTIFSFSVSHTTRPKSKFETHKIDYFFIDHKHFKKMIARNEFLEWEEVNSNLYGTSVKQIETILSDGKVPLLDIEVNGAERIRKYAEIVLGRPFSFTPIFLDVPCDVQEMRIRERKRGETEEEIQKRLKRYEMENAKKHSFDHIIPNINLNEAYTQILESVVRPRLLHRQEMQTM
ncbi:MAG: guanylate kinase [Patescibacteria group bacterium]|nr:guanylate kinase [Patescibacteria group bacterium]MDQ5962044.1 guanylate kinase [Patescibacteria group bacterium]